MTEEEIIATLDYSNDGYYCSFVSLGDVYSYLVDSRLTVFRDDDDRWAIAIERLGYNPRAGAILLDIFYYGNCLVNLAYYNERPTNYYSIYLIDRNNFADTTEEERVKPGAQFWLVRGQQVLLNHNKQDYLDAGIEWKEYEPNEIRIEEAARLMVMQNRDLFRATDVELYKSIPPELKKILVIDEWFHKDFPLQVSPILTDEQLRQTYELNQNITSLGGMSFESFVQSVKLQAIANDDWNKEIWKNNRPGSYETWPLIAKVIITNDPQHYKPTLKPTTHWANWPDSGSM